MKHIFYSLLIVFALFLTGCADAGKNQSVTSGDTVILDGSKSTPETGGQITRYSWHQLRGFGPVVELSNAQSVQAHFIAPLVTEDTTLIFKLKTIEVGGRPHRFHSVDYVKVVVKAESEETDTTKPVLTLNGDTNITLTVGDIYVDAGATAIDNKDGNITDSITVDNPVDTTTTGRYTITYTVSDEAGNEAVETRTVTIELPADTTAPVIALNGGDVTLTVGETYTEQGATATDDRDGNVTVDINGTVDTTHAGVYTIIYTASDLAGNQALPITRTVTVNTLTNHAPTANDLSVTTSKNTSLDINVTAEDSDGDTLMYNLHIMPNHGTLTGELPNVIYTPNANYVGTDYFTFSVMDGHEATSSEANVSITITDTATHNPRISGKVIDSNGTAVSGATVAIAGHIVTTSTDGSYTLLNIPAEERVLVNVTHPNYLANSRVTEVNATDVNLNITLDRPKATLTFDAANGATISQSNGASVELPANGYIDANGTAYTGAVTVKMSYHAITTLSGRATFPGTFEGIEGNTTFPIQSYGFMNVELTDPQGNALNLDGNSTATLTFPRDNNIYPQPTTIPLWYYDVSQGYWVQEGEANPVNYSSYVGTVTHFTSWNLDAKGPRASFKGCVEDNNGVRVPNALVQFRSVNWDSYILPTDTNGDISVINILAGEDLTFSAFASINNEFYTGSYPSTLNINEGENRVLTECIILKPQGNLPNQITVTGTAIDRQGNPVSYGKIYITEYRTAGILSVGNSNADGTFSISFSRKDALIYTIGNNFDGYLYGTDFTLQPNTNIYDVGSIRISNYNGPGIP